MKLRFAGLVLAASLLGACTDADWDHTMSFVGMGDSPGGDPPPAAATTAQNLSPPARPATPAAAASSDEAWCREVATYERQNAAGMGYDAATQQHDYDTRYNQCMQYSSGKPQ